MAAVMVAEEATVVVDTEDIEYPDHSSNVKVSPSFHPIKNTPFSSGVKKSRLP